MQVQPDWEHWRESGKIRYILKRAIVVRIMNKRDLNICNMYRAYTSDNCSVHVNHLAFYLHDWWLWCNQSCCRQATHVSLTGSNTCRVMNLIWRYTLNIPPQPYWIFNFKAFARSESCSLFILSGGCYLLLVLFNSQLTLLTLDQWLPLIEGSATIKKTTADGQLSSHSSSLYIVYTVWIHTCRDSNLSSSFNKQFPNFSSLVKHFYLSGHCSKCSAPLGL